VIVTRLLVMHIFLAGQIRTSCVLLHNLRSASSALRGWNRLLDSRQRSGERTIGFRTMADDSPSSEDIRRAAAAIHGAKALVFTSGAGMGVDSGLPDFRGPQGFWRAYPALRDRGIKLSSMSTPHWFKDDPTFAWGFFGHRYNLYKNAEPHDGFRIILNWCRKMENGYFAFTSNVDGHLQVRTVIIAF